MPPGVAPSPAAARALFRALLRWSAAHPDAGGRELAAEASAAFREAAAAPPDAAAALFQAGEARLYDAVHHSIPFPRLAHASQHSVRALQDAARMAGAGAPVGDAAAAAEAAAAGAADPGVAAALAAAAARLRAKAAGGGGGPPKP